MSNEHSREPRPPTYAEIYRQIALILRDGDAFEKRSQELHRILEGLDYETLARVPELRLVAIQLAPEEDVARVLVNLRRSRDVVETAEQNRVLRSSWVVDDTLYRHQLALWRLAAEPAWHQALSTLKPQTPGRFVARISRVAYSVPTHTLVR